MGVNGEARLLSALLAPLGDEVVAGAESGGDATIQAIVDDSRRARNGALFVALRGTGADGHDHAAASVRAGAVAVVAERDIPDLGVPTVRVRDSHRALALLAAEWFGRPADRLRLIGVTGTVGKTTVIAMLETILARAGMRPGVIGSLGSGWGDDKHDTGMTTPGPLELHESLARIAPHADTALIEVTSHALVQERVHGLRFPLGIFTNLVMLEHLEFHETFQQYVEAKSRFFEHVDPEAPLIYPAGDRLLDRLVADRPVRAVPCGSGTENVALHIERMAMTSHGTRLLFQIEEPYPRVDGSFVPPMTLPAALKLLGRAAVNNASLAAAAALSLGVDPETTAVALTELAPLPRRMQVLRPGPVTLLDDTVGHPDSISGVFEVAEVVPHDRMFVVYAIRGRRGAHINQRDAEAVAIWTRRLPVERIVVTAAADVTDDANAVQPDEREAFLEGLADSAAPHSYHDGLEDAIAEVVPLGKPSDLVMLLGAQGMNQGAAIALRLLGRQ
ncbi:MAG TPA: Mur ligase family protein [Longimicrobiales bacterium]|nr:Mur ligase family protein [Longimicrobiales bacterium]